MESVISDHKEDNRKGILSWICVVYALLVVAIGFTLPIVFGMSLVVSPKALDEFVDFYSILYAVGLVLLILHHLAAKTPMKIFKSLKHFCHTLSNCFKNICPKKTQKVATGDKIAKCGTTNGQVEEHLQPKHKSDVKMSSGRVGLKFGVKISFVVLLIMILMELSVYVEIKLADPECEYGSKTTDVVLFFLFVFAQTAFVMGTTQEDLEDYWFINHLCVAHLVATTICLGVFLTTQDCLFKLFYLYFKLVGALDEENPDPKSNDHLPVWVSNYKVQVEQEQPSSSNETDPCSLANYINQVNKQIKPFTHHFNMIYVYCMGILLILIFMHLRKQVYTTSNNTGFFKYVNSKSATFSSGAGVTLIVVSVITAILTIHAATNAFVAIFLILLHFQATVVAFFALKKIANLPCTIRKENSKYPVIFLIYYFFVVLISIFEAITKVQEADEDPSFVIILEILVEVLDMIQAFLHGVLILIGFYTIIPSNVLRNVEMPTEILIHLAATNFAALVSSIFVSESKLSALEAVFKNSETLAEANSLMAWTVLDSITAPAEEFSRFFTIICLVKLHKLWTTYDEADSDVAITRI